MEFEGPTLGVALALLAVGALLGDLWARLRSPAGHRGGKRGRPHYLLGLNYLVSNQHDLAIHELTQAVRQETDAVEAYVALGNLLRERGQTERAIDLHKSLLHRPSLSDWERTQVLFSLALDFKRAGLLDRAERTLLEVQDRDPGHVGCMRELQEIAVEFERWEEALRLERKIQSNAHGREQRLIPALYTEWGRSLTRERPDEAELHFRAALDDTPDYAPARVGIGVCLLQRGKISAALEHLEEAIKAGPPWGLAALDALRQACLTAEDDERFERACQQILRGDPRAWRAWLELARLRVRRQEFPGALDALRKALAARPASLAVQRELAQLLEREGKDMRDFVAHVENALGDAPHSDPFVCLRCMFKSRELLGRCPHCHAWNTMTQERSE